MEKKTLHKKTFETKLRGEDISLEVSELAGQTNASVIGKRGNTVVLATAVMGKEDRPGDFFPLTVEYEEKFYAAGKILGSRFVRREGRPSEEAVLSGRLIDRTIRPLFDHRLRREVQVTITILAYEEKSDPDMIALLAASAALAISDIPWNGPVAGVDIHEKDGNGNEINAFLAGIADQINMIEVEGNEMSKEDALRIYKDSQKHVAELIAFQKKIVDEIGKPKTEVALQLPPEELVSAVKDILGKQDIAQYIRDKNVDGLRNLITEEIVATEKFEDPENQIEQIMESEIDAFVHKEILESDRRPDGRGLSEIRPLYGEVGLFELTHGSGLFMRGNTQVLSLTTLGSPSAEQLVESMENTTKKRFMLHYNFPSFSVGETGRSRGPGRREIGHGNLATKALRAVIPSHEEFPYTIRVVGETLSSNGSSSMATTCASSLSLMDAGVPIRKHVAGIAMGLITNPETGDYKILTDIQGPEDHYGDMDFKVAGTDAGINAIQMDVKIYGITEEMFSNALDKAEEARLQILELMNGAIDSPRPSVSKYAPKIVTIKVPQEKIGEVIGAGGKTINRIIEESGNQVEIDIEEDGTVSVSGVDESLVQKALESVEATVHEYQVGEIITGKIIRILDFGAIVDLGGGKDGMIHVSELKDGFVKEVTDVVSEGEVVTAKVVKADRDGKIGLSLKNVPELSTPQEK